MGRLATRADFEGLTHGRPGAALYDRYRRYPFHAGRAAWIATRYPGARTVLVAGAGYGFLVDELVARGVDAWGFDASAYAVDAAREHLPEATRARIVRADAADPASLVGVLARAGTRTVDLVVSEDLLPCADSDAEARRWIANLRAVGTTVLHVCTPNALLAKTHAGWAAFCRPDRVLCTETWRCS